MTYHEDHHSDPLPTPATIGKTPVKRVLGPSVEILEGYGPTRLHHVIYLDDALAAAVLNDGSGRFERAQPASAPAAEPDPHDDPVLVDEDLA